MNRIIAVGLLFLVTPCAVRALDANAAWDVQDKEWETVFDESSVLHRYDEHDRAALIAKKALQVAEEKWGPSHFRVAQSLLLLGSCFEDQGQYAQAEAAYKRALDIVEKVTGPDAPTIAGYAFSLAGIYRRTERQKEAETLEARAKLMITEYVAQQRAKPHVAAQRPVPIPEAKTGTR